LWRDLCLSGVGCDLLWLRFFAFQRAFPWNVRNNAFRGGRRESLGNGLLATAASTATSTAAASTASSLAVSAGGGRSRLRLLRGAGALFRSGLRLEFGCGRRRGF